MPTPPPSPFTESERSVLAQVGSRLHARGAAPWVTVELLLRSWARFAESVGYTRSMTYEFGEYLSRRDRLEEAVSECPAPLAQKLEALLHEADEKYRAATGEDGGRSLSKFIRNIGTAWWWQRRPYTGPLSTFLDEE